MSKRFANFERSWAPKKSAMHTYGGPSQQRCFFYGGPQKQRMVDPADQIPSFSTIAKNRCMKEVRFFLNNSNTKWISLGIVPSTKILDPEAPGFYFEAFICGDKCAPLPLGGIKGLTSLFETVREIPGFNQFPSVKKSGIEQSNNITISTCSFADDVYKIVNLNNKDASMYLASTSFFNLMQSEEAVLASANSFNAGDMEAKFNTMLESGLKNYKAMKQSALEDGVEIDILVNFKELFDVCMDIKKSEAARTTPEQSFDDTAA